MHLSLSRLATGWRWQFVKRTVRKASNKICRSSLGRVIKIKLMGSGQFCQNGVSILRASKTCKSSEMMFDNHFRFFAVKGLKLWGSKYRRFFNQSEPLRIWIKANLNGGHCKWRQEIEQNSAVSGSKILHFRYRTLDEEASSLASSSKI